MDVRSHTLRTSGRRLVAAGAALGLVAAGFGLTATPAAAAGPGPTSAAGIVPVHVDGAANRSCQSLADELAPGATWTEVKFEADRGEVVTGATKSGVTLTSVVGKVIDWTSTAPVVAVYVKSGSEGSNLYHHPAGSTGDEGLGTPGLQQAISHVSFCSGPLSVEEPPPLDCELTPTAEGCEVPELTCEDDASLEGCEVAELTCEDDATLEGCEEAEGIEPEPTCADDPDLEGCTEIGTPVFIENRGTDSLEQTGGVVVVSAASPVRTEVQGAVFTQPPAAVAGATEAGSLPRTGTPTTPLVAAALALLLTGAGFVAAGRREDHIVAA